MSVRTSKAFLGGHNGATTIGNNVTVGHSVLLDCVTIEDEALIGMGATLLEGVKVCSSLVTFFNQDHPCPHVELHSILVLCAVKMCPFHSSQGTNVLLGHCCC